MIGDRVLDDFQQFLLGVGRADAEAVEKLHHQAGETLESTWDADGWADFDEDAFGGRDVDLEEAGLVHGGVEEGEEALFSFVSPHPYSV